MATPPSILRPPGLFAPQALPPPASRDRLAQAERLLAGGQIDAARAVLLPALDSAALRPDARGLLAVAALMSQQIDEALTQVQEALRLAPRHARHHLLLGRVHKAAQRVDEAVAAYRAALELDPMQADAHVSLGIALKQQGQLDEAIACYRRAIEINPRLGVAHANLGNALAEQAVQSSLQPDDDVDPQVLAPMLESVQQALALDPRNPELHANQGQLLRRVGRLEDAIDAFNRALGLDPANVQYCVLLGICLDARGLHNEAVELYRRWLGTHPPAAPVMRLLSTLLTLLGQADEALDWAERAMALDPDASAYSQLGNAYNQRRRLPESAQALERSLELSEDRHDFFPLLLLFVNYLHEDPEPIAALQRRYGQALARAVPSRPRPVPRPRLAADGTTRRLRVGFLSGDFVRHSVAYFAAPLLEHIDRERFEVVCYHNRAYADAVTHRFIALGHAWRDVQALGDTQLAQRIRDDNLDVLVDLSGHTANSRLPVLQRRPAPVQVGYLGYPTATGVPEMDFRITDTVIDAGDLPLLGSDRPLCLPRSMFCYRPDAEPPIGPPPSAASGVVTFGSFNNLAKLTDRTLALWARAMHAVPGSRLLLKAAALGQAGNQADVQRVLAGHGIAPERVLMRPQVQGLAEHLSQYDDMDVALDTFPYNGATTTCEALWMGVPVVSRRGRTHASRMAASILGAAGCADWVTDDDDAFVALAQQLAADVDARARWRVQAREHLRTSVLMDEAGFARHFGQALRRACDAPESTFA